MSLQDNINLVITSIITFTQAKISLVVPVTSALIIFLLGLVTATLLKKIWFRITQFLEIEKSLSKNSSYQHLVKTNKYLSITEFVGQLIWWLTILLFLFPSLKILHLGEVDLIVDQFLTYLPKVANGAFYLFLGSVAAWFVYLLVLAIGSLTKLISADLIARLVATAVAVFSLLLALKAFGINQDILRIIILASIGASALAFGLAGKDLASTTIKKLRDLIK